MLGARLGAAVHGSGADARDCAVSSGRSSSSCGRTRGSSGSSSSRRSCSSRCSATRRRPTCATCRSSSPTATDSPASRDLIERFDASRNFTRDRHGGNGRRHRPVPAARARVDRAGDPAGLRRRRSRTAGPVALQVVADGSPTRTRRPWRSAMRRASSAEYAQDLVAARRRRARGAVPPGHRAAHPRLVQPAAREPVLHDPGRPGAAAAGRDRQPRRRWASCARRRLGTLEQLNVTPLRRVGAHRRQAPAVRRSSAWSTCCS